MPTSLSGPRYALRILIGTTIVWLLLAALGDDNPVWGLVSLVVVSEPQLQATMLNFHSRLINTLLGAVIAMALLFFIPQFHHQYWAVMVGMAVAVLVCTSVFTTPGNWKIAPVTVCIIMAAGVHEQSRLAGLETALWRTGEVLLGSLVAVVVTWAALYLRRPAAAPDPDEGSRAADSKP